MPAAATSSTARTLSDGGATVLPRPRGLVAALLVAAACATAGGCSARAGGDELAHASSDAGAPAPAAAPVDGEAVAYFAGGCFWGVEFFLEKLPGVIAVESGYMGGHIENPSYEQVVAHQTGHLESVRVRYDPAKIGYGAIARRFFEIHDPTQANGQGPDIGPQYLSAVFVANEAERRTTEELIAKLRARGYDVVTEIKPATTFYSAEDYHQDYYVRHEKLPYCHAPVDRFGGGE
jgi:peptide methionine sulfoxide reductase msrA/msrB